jgi:hypothetical protein
MLRFTIRDLLWLMVVIAVALVAFVENQKQTAAYRRLKAELEDTQVNAGISQFDAKRYQGYLQSASDGQEFWHKKYSDLIKRQEQHSQTEVAAK